MTDSELRTMFEKMALKANAAVDELLVWRQKSEEKAKLRYCIKKLEIIIGACNRALDKLNSNV